MGGRKSQHAKEIICYKTCIGVIGTDFRGILNTDWKNVLLYISQVESIRDQSHRFSETTFILYTVYGCIRLYIQGSVLRCFKR